ncbi:Dynamin-like GTPase that mediates homotypic ER fusion [Trichoderma virens FT-333]|nr:Dynamin-like GTPase that mediates homotypic ER fusion [Trichoderma virens FT-333]
MNGHFSAVGDQPANGNYDHGCQVIDEEKEFNRNLNDYLQTMRVAEAGFNYHLISVFGSQSTGKSTLLNHLFGTTFSVMSETERRQTTKGIWVSKNKRETSSGTKMADNILVMDVEGTDGRERGEDQDFERKSALFALATSEVLLINIWEHQVGLYQGANMGLLKTLNPRSLLFFVIRDHIGVTPLSALQNTLIQDLTKIWSSISKPEGLEQSRIEDYFDFGFAALPHKILQGEKFESEVALLGARFTTGHRVGKGEDGAAESEGGILLPEYHRRIPADGLSVYTEGIWDQIVNNKDLDLPTQQELLAQFRCDEISREVLVAFDLLLNPLEEQQSQASKLGKAIVLPDLGTTASQAREKCFRAFEVQASRYHKGVYSRKKQELESKVDGRLKTLYQGQIAAAHKAGVAAFSEAVSNKVKTGQKAGGAYEFAEIVSNEKKKTMEIFKAEVDSLAIEGVEWTNFVSQNQLFEAELDEVSSKLRKDEIRRLATRVERWVKSRLGDAVGLEFNKLGSGRGGSGAPEEGQKPATEKDLWDRIWKVFIGIVSEAESRFADRAKSFDASDAEVDVGLWRLRRKSWTALREKIEEEVMEGNILLKLRENFEDKFRYDDAGVPRIWRPTDDIEGIYTKARESTLTLIPLLSKFKLLSSNGSPDLIGFIGAQPSGVEAGDEEDLTPIGGVDEEDGKSLEEEMTMLSENKRQDLVVRFKKTADGVYVEAKRSAIGGMTQVPWYFYVLLLVLGWNEIWMVLRNPLMFILLILISGGTYTAWYLNLLGPMMQMGNAAVNQGMDIAKQQLREFVANSDTARQALAMPARQDSDISMDTLDSRGRKKTESESPDDF